MPLAAASVSLRSAMTIAVGALLFVAARAPWRLQLGPAGARTDVVDVVDVAVATVATVVVAVAHTTCKNSKAAVGSCIANAAGVGRDGGRAVLLPLLVLFLVIAVVVVVIVVQLGGVPCQGEGSPQEGKRHHESEEALVTGPKAGRLHCCSLVRIGKETKGNET